VRRRPKPSPTPGRPRDAIGLPRVSSAALLSTTNAENAEIARPRGRTWGTSRAWASSVGLASTLLLAGCNGCKHTNPYVPFLEDAGNAVARDGEIAALDSATDGANGGGFAQLRATLAPPGTTKWSLDGLAFEAPAGAQIVAALAADLDGDGERDVVGYVQPSGGGGGELRFWKGSGGALGPSRAVGGAAFGVDVALPAPCVGKPTLSMVGPHSISLDLRPSCGDAAPAHRRFFYAAFAPTPSIRWAARVVEPPAGLTFDVEASARDEDGDGVDDPTFRITLGGSAAPLEPGDPLIARLRYIDRAAGLSRDRNEPEASFQLIGNRASQLAGKKATAKGVAATVKRLRLLYAAMCKEGSPWLEPSGEHGIECGRSLGLHVATLAQARAAMTLGDLFDASALRDHVVGNSGWNGSKAFSALDGQLRAAAPERTATLREAAALPATGNKGAPAWGALAFDGAGAMLIRTVTGVVRFEGNGVESEAGDVATWPWEVQWPDGKDARLAGAAAGCDQPWILARVAGHDVPTGTAFSPLPLLPRLDKGRCVDGRAPSLAVVPIGWSDAGLLASIDGELAYVPKTIGGPGSALAYDAGMTTTPVRGGPRSPNGAYLVLPSRLGLLRREESTGAFVRVTQPALEGVYAALRECTVSNDGNRIACVRDGRAILLDLASAATASPSSTTGAPTPAAPSASPSGGEPSSGGDKTKDSKDKEGGEAI
jgi:hypothetical protein